jgi:hypothetical protein
MIWRRKNRIDPEEQLAVAVSAAEQLEEQQERVNALTAYLERRKMQNGFGRDFEFTFIPKESR